MKKLLALLLALVMGVACFASCGKNTSGSSDSGESTSGSTSESTSDTQGGVDKGKQYITIDYEDEVEQVNYSKDPLKIDGRPLKKDGASYTYNVAVSSLPTSWNIHTYQSNDGTYVLDYTEDVLYTFDYTQDLKGFRIVPSMANDYPVDVSANYVGEQWNISAGETGRAYKIPLRSNLKFDNGDAIKAQDFADSVELLLNPEAANYRADGLYGKNLTIFGAEKYFKQGSYSSTGSFLSEDLAENEYVDPAQFTTGADGVLTYNGQDLCVDLSDGGNWGSALSLYNEYNYFSKSEVASAAYKALKLAADENNLVKLTPALLRNLQDCIAVLHGRADVEDYAENCETTINGVNYAYVECEEMLVYGKLYESYEFKNVGMFADPADPDSLIIILDKKLTGFYLYYSLNTSFYLVHTNTYKSCMSTSQGVYTNSYGTSKDTYVGFGPYKLTKFVDGNIAEFEKNNNWYGYSLEENANNYWTTKITMKQVLGEDTRLQMFLEGELDTYGLSAKDMDEYQSSKYVYYTEGDSTWFLALNPNLQALKNMQSSAKPNTPGNEVNKTILTLKEFRQALSFSLDRAAYELQLDPTGSVAKALFGNMIISDPLTGTTYRSTEEAKDTILKFWGLEDEVGEGKEYETKDEAIAAITGYDLSGARILFDRAYDKAVEQGLISKEAAESGKFEIQIVIGQPGEGGSAYYNDGYELLKNVWTEAVKGTKLEGKLVFTQSQPLSSTNFSSYLKNNTVDLLFGVGWTGSALDPFGLMEVYVAPNYQYDPAWNTKDETLDIEIEGYTLRASLYDWGKTALAGEEIEANVIENGEITNKFVKLNAGTGTKASIRLAILAAVEGAVLNQYDMIPVGTEASASLKGMKIQYCTEEYVYGVGRGGVKYMTYNYTDAEWADYVKAQGGKLNYKASK